MVASSPNACLFIVTGVYKTRGEASGKGVLSVLWNGAWANVYTWTLLFFFRMQQLRGDKPKRYSPNI